MSIAVFILALLPAGLPLQDPTPIESKIAEVTVFSGSALVSRSAELPAGRGLFVLEGLPLSLDPESVRVRCAGAAVVGVEVRERERAALSNERLQELRGRLRTLERELSVLSDERRVLQDLGEHLKRLLDVEAAAHTGELSQGRPNPDAWRQNLAFLREQMLQNKTDLRENGWSIEELNGQIGPLALELDGFESGSGVRLRDIQVAVDGGAGRPASLEVEYRVSDASWSPVYDLRTAPNARSVELTYRARVRQQSGEDWVDCAVLLSTAQPQRGAQGPDPQPVWLRLHDPKAARGRKSAPSSMALAEEEPSAAGFYEDGGDFKASTESFFAAVESQGLSVRYRIVRRESIESRREPTHVLVGQTTLEVQPEYFATPALDTNVWLRGRTANTSDWTLLPGRAAVYFGADFIGHAQLDLVQPGAEITLHLGPDPALSIERKQVEDLRKEPGMFSSRARQIDRWRVEVTNNGAAAAGPDGTARVFVREVVPRTTDDRIKVELGETRPQPSGGERWKQGREEQGILTWPLSVPPGGKAHIVWETRISYPEGMRVLR